jgi:acyl-ACP thioesterase
MKTMRPKALTSTLSEVWGSSTSGREVGARQVVKPSVVRASGATRMSSNWVTRFSDFDALEHMNNAAYWEIMEEQLIASRHLREDVRFLVEHHDGITPGAHVEVQRFDVSPSEVTLLVEADGQVQAGMWFGSR